MIKDLKRAIKLINGTIIKKSNLTEKNRKKLSKALKALKDDEKVINDCQDEWPAMENQIREIERGDYNDSARTENEVVALANRRDLGTGPAKDLTYAEEGKLRQYVRDQATMVVNELRVLNAADNVFKSI